MDPQRMPLLQKPEITMPSQMPQQSTQLFHDRRQEVVARDHQTVVRFHYSLTLFFLYQDHDYLQHQVDQALMSYLGISFCFKERNGCLWISFYCTRPLTTAVTSSYVNGRPNSFVAISSSNFLAIFP